LDDVEPGTPPAGFPDPAAAHVWLAKGLHEESGVKSQELGADNDSLATCDSPLSTRLLVVPTYYWTEGARAHAEYTAGLARGLPPEVGVFWTGTEVRSHAITAAQAREAAELFGRKPVVWLNYA